MAFLVNENWHFIGRFNIGILPRMINKGVLAQFLFVTCLINWKIVYHEKTYTLDS